MRRLIAGNWKMNGTIASLSEIVKLDEMVTTDIARGCDVLICPPATLLRPAKSSAPAGRIAIGAQDCHAEKSGAFTGDLSAEMLVEAGARYIIVGHSERRAAHGETDADVCAKAEAAIGAGAVAIICVGESKGQRESGEALDVVEAQIRGSVPEDGDISKLVIAYEPVWAIGTGLTPKNEDIAEMHAAIRAQLMALFGDKASQIRILYGGSMKPDNAADILGIANVDGGLIGGASLKAESFFAIIAAA